MMIGQMSWRHYRGKTSALVIMDDGDVMDSQIFEKTESGWKLPEDSEFQDTKRLQETGL